jgi:hypothetical protein
MGRPGGLPKTGGRTKGTPNKRSLSFEESLADLCFNPVRELVALMPRLSSEKQADVCLQLLQYLFPKRKALELRKDPAQEYHDDLESKTVEEIVTEAERIAQEMRKTISPSWPGITVLPAPTKTK